MTLARRVEAIEAGVDVTTRIVKWLGEAHVYGSLERYSDAVLEAGPTALPLDRLSREAREAARAQRAAPTEIDDAVRQTLFRVHLVLQIDERIKATMERQELIGAYLSLALAVAMDQGARARSWLSIELLRDMLMDRVVALLAIDAAGRQLDVLYFDGAETLFPETCKRWATLIHEAKSAAVMADRVCELDGLPALDVDWTVPTDERIKTISDDLAEAARIKTLDDTGEGPALLRRLRAYGQRAEAADPVSCSRRTH